MSVERSEEQFELLSRHSSIDTIDELDSSYELPPKYATRSAWTRLLSPRRPSKVYRTCFGRRRALFKWSVIFAVLLVILTGIFHPSYTHLPPHYQALKQRATESTEPGRANLNNEKIFLCISLYDKGGTLAGGRWGQSLLDLIDLLGPANTFLSIYENSSGPEGEAALRELEKKATCEKKIVYEDIDKSTYPKIELPDGRMRTKRLMYLSDIRNKALRPLDTVPKVDYDKILFLNDIYFDPVDAAQLLFSTNQQADGRTDYLATCSMDFFMFPMKFYDLFATRDADGYSMGIPIFPFFSSAGSATSRNDMLAQKDAVRVKSCWGGMAAFMAKPFIGTTETLPPGFDEPNAHNIDPEKPVPVSVPIRFRAEPEPFFDFCECCLLMADALKVTNGTTQVKQDTRIYMNPYIRVAYSTSMLYWIPLVTRFERLYSPIQWLVNTIAHMPTWNPYREAVEGEPIKQELWNPRNKTMDSHWEMRERKARNGMYCAVREMHILKQDEDRTKDRNWIKIEVPDGREFF